jgi:hypothetical protein
VNPDEAPVDPLPGLIAGIDQALKMAGEVARAHRAYYDAFIEEGFTERQALYAAVSWLKGTGEPPA